jgi:hypothetical protein
MCTPSSPLEGCLEVAVDALDGIQDACGDAVAAVSSLVAQTFPAACRETNAEAAWHDAFVAPRGSAHTLAACAAAARPDLAVYGGMLDPSWLRFWGCAAMGALNVPAERAAAGGDDDDERRASVRLPYAASLGLLLAVALVALARAGARRLRRHRHRIVAWWVALAVCSAPMCARVDRTVDPDGFLVEDEVTRCARDLLHDVPSAVGRDHLLTVVAPRREALAAYRAAMTTTPVAGASTLQRDCGGCKLIAWNATHTPSPDVAALLLADGTIPAGDDDAPVAFSVQLPSHWTSAMRQAHLDAAPWPAGAVHSSMRQSLGDAQRSAEPPPAVLGASGLLTTLVCGGAARRYVHTGALAVTMGSIALLGASVLASDALALGLLGLPFSPFNLLAMPLVIGTGLDALFLLLHHRATGARRWVEHTLPSVVASHLSTVVCFLVGTVLPIPHVRHFFLYMALCLLVSLAAQATALPALVVLASKVRVGDGGGGGLAPFASRGVVRRAAPIGAVVVLWLALLRWHAPLRHTVDPQRQLRADTMTYRFFAAADAMARTPRMPVYALTAGYDHDWAALDARAERDLARCLRAPPQPLSWHPYLPRNTSLEAWLADPRTRFLVHDAFDFDRRLSVALFVAESDLHADPARAREELRCLHAAAASAEADAAADGPRPLATCYASLERLAGYTVVTLVDELRWLALVSCGVATVFALAIVRARGLLALASLGLSYAGTVGLLGALDLPVDLLLVAVLLIAPGIVVDFTMHLLFQEDAGGAVLASAATSVASALPYALMPVESVREFVVVYCLFVVLGAVHAFALVSLHRLVAYERVAGDEATAAAALAKGGADDV